MRKIRVEHGLSRHPLYKIWQDLIQRCHNPLCQRYPWYGGAGVTVCDEWQQNPVAFINWCLDNGWIQGMEIDKDTKIRGNKIYSPDTCLIVSHRTNMIAVVGRESGRKTSKLKLSIQDVSDIVARRKAGELTRDLAATYQVDIRTINRVFREHR